MHLANMWGFLQPRRVKQRLELFALAHVFGIGNDTNDLDLAMVYCKGHMMAERVIIGKECAIEALIDDGDTGRVLVILRRESASAQQRDFHCRQIVLARDLAVGVVWRGVRFAP